MTARERQAAELLATRERQVARFETIERLIEDGTMRTHHGWGVCVKAHDVNCECEPDEPFSWDSFHCACGYELAREVFWQDAHELAGQWGFVGVYSAGRGGGYCLVNPQPHMDDMWEADQHDYLHERLGPFVLDVLANLEQARKLFKRGRLVTGETIADAFA